MKIPLQRVLRRGWFYLIISFFTEFMIKTQTWHLSNLTQLPDPQISWCVQIFSISLSLLQPATPQPLALKCRKYPPPPFRFCLQLLVTAGPWEVKIKRLNFSDSQFLHESFHCGGACKNQTILYLVVVSWLQDGYLKFTELFTSKGWTSLCVN